MADPTDWKTKHLNSLREMELEERRWRALEQVLRRLVNRLCAAAMGIDPRLDTQLSKLAEANRRGADVTELGARHDSLSDTLKALDSNFGSATLTDLQATIPASRTQSAPPAAAPAVNLAAIRAAAAKLLERIAAHDPTDTRIADIKGQLASAGNDAAFAGVLARMADLVGELGADVARERAAAAAVLGQVTERLEEMANYIGSLNDERRARLDDADTLNTAVLSQVGSLSAEARNASDLPTLRALVASGLESVATQVRDFHAREGKRSGEQSARAETLRARITELERESRELNRTLDLERRHSRLDPLTKIANRPAFDERFTEELGRLKRFHTPVALLLWDIDRFKGINDSYGHRVGDAVLREVAACLAVRLRSTDLVARYGGEEFGMLLVGSTLAEVTALAEELRQSIAALGFHFKGTPVAVTASCGITELKEGDTAASAFDRADGALYRAKEAGRNRCLAA